MRTLNILGASSTVLLALTGVASAFPTPKIVSKHYANSEVGIIPAGAFNRDKARDNLFEREAEPVVEDVNVVAVPGPGPHLDQHKYHHHVHLAQAGEASNDKPHDPPKAREEPLLGLQERDDHPHPLHQHGHPGQPQHSGKQQTAWDSKHRGYEALQSTELAEAGPPTVQGRGLISWVTGKFHRTTPGPTDAGATSMDPPQKRGVVDWFKNKFRSNKNQNAGSDAAPSDAEKRSERETQGQEHGKLARRGRIAEKVKHAFSKFSKFMKGAGNFVLGAAKSMIGM